MIGILILVLAIASAGVVSYIATPLLYSLFGQIHRLTHRNAAPVAVSVSDQALFKTPFASPLNLSGQFAVASVLMVALVSINCDAATVPVHGIENHG